MFSNYSTFETKPHNNCSGEWSRHCEIYRDFENASDGISALSDVNKKIHFGAARATRVYSSPKPANYIQTPS